jgi:PASTA domain
VDDDLGLLPDEQAGPPPPRRPLGLLVGGLVAVALLVVAGAVWMVASVSDRVPNVKAAGSASPAPATTAAPSTTPAATTAPPTTAAPTSAGPVRTATTVVVTPPPPAPKPTPKPTTVPAPTPRPLPKPTLTIPLARVPDVVGLRVQQASAVLRAAGFTVQVIGGVQDPERDDRRITAQRPGAGAVVRAGSTVILVTDGT